MSLLPPLLLWTCPLPLFSYHPPPYLFLSFIHILPLTPPSSLSRLHPDHTPASIVWICLHIRHLMNFWRSSQLRWKKEGHLASSSTMRQPLEQILVHIARCSQYLLPAFGSSVTYCINLHVVCLYILPVKLLTLHTLMVTWTSSCTNLCNILFVCIILFNRTLHVY